MEIVLALFASLMFAIGTVLQQKAGLDEPVKTEGSGLLLQMARRPAWMAGIAADVVGFGAQAVALTIGRLAVVQPLLVLGVVFALPLGVRLTHQKIGPLDVGAAVIVVCSLGVFLFVADPSGGRNDAPLGQWLIAGSACAVVSGALFTSSRTARPALKAALLGTATGVLFGLVAALTKSVGDQVENGVLQIFTHGHLYALIAAAYVGLTFNQMALNTGRLAPAIATSMAFDPVVSVILGLTLLQEGLDTTAGGKVVGVMALVVALGGLGVLARRREGATAAKPVHGTHVVGAKTIAGSGPPRPVPADPAN
jgi:drug/metabolite transporter (DMT)-like permease